MDINERIAALYEKDTKLAYASLQQLEALSMQGDALYPYLGEFIAMLGSGRYVVRVRGFRLLCLQARWDAKNLIDDNIDAILAALNDPKPTAVRQMLQYLAYLAPHKKALGDKIEKAATGINLSRFRDTMLPLVQRDIHSLQKVLGRA